MGEPVFRCTCGRSFKGRGSAIEFMQHARPHAKRKSLWWTPAVCFVSGLMVGTAISALVNMVLR